MNNQNSRIFKFSIVLLAYNLLVILWGALVRATGSGAGCGDHWPLCDGKVLPGLSDLHRIIEFSHRISVGIDLLLVLILFVLSVYPVYNSSKTRYTVNGKPALGIILKKCLNLLGQRSSLVRLFQANPILLGAVLTVIFTLSESIVGAGLVLFKLVAHDASLYRAVAVSVHLVNTLFLVASLTLTVWWAAGHNLVGLKNQGGVLNYIVIIVLGTIIIAVTGAVTALGDTLFPASSTSELGRMVPATAHFLMKLRIYHPIVAIVVGGANIVSAFQIARMREDDQTRSLAFIVIVMVVVQIALGFTNLMMFAPLALQLLHLLAADGLWISIVLLSATSLAQIARSDGADQSGVA